MSSPSHTLFYTRPFVHSDGSGARANQPESPRWSAGNRAELHAMRAALTSLALAFALASTLACGPADSHRSVSPPSPPPSAQASAPAHASPALDTTPPSGPAGIAVSRGRALLAATRDSLPSHVGNALRCFSCHLDEGRRASALPLDRLVHPLSPIPLAPSTRGSGRGSRERLLHSQHERTSAPCNRRRHARHRRLPRMALPRRLRARLVARRRDPIARHPRRRLGARLEHLRRELRALSWRIGTRERGGTTAVGPKVLQHRRGHGALSHGRIVHRAQHALRSPGNALAPASARRCTLRRHPAPPGSARKRV